MQWTCPMGAYGSWKQVEGSSRPKFLQMDLCNKIVGTERRVLLSGSHWLMGPILHV